MDCELCYTLLIFAGVYIGIDLFGLVYNIWIKLEKEEDDDG